MLALITNDDGIQSPGISVLAEVARRVFDRVVVVAPRGQQSAVSHAITINKMFRVFPDGQDRYALEATPADCVFYAVRQILDQKPDYVLSGVNLGPNLGFDTLYSGTVAGAREGLMHGIRSISFSLAANRPVPFDQAAPVIEQVLRNAGRFDWDPDVMLNVNIPSREMFSDPKGFRACSLGTRVFDNKTAQFTDPMGNTHGWIGGREFALKGDDDSDCVWLKKGYVTITPLTWNLCSKGMKAAVRLAGDLGTEGALDTAQQGRSR
jgi:5'-nucleotidase